MNDQPQKRSRSINWSEVFLTNDFRSVAAVQPLPSEEAADNLDGPKPSMTCASILSFLMELPVRMREELFRCLLVGDVEPNVSQLAKEAHVSRQTWYDRIHKASEKVWGTPVPPFRRLGEAFVKKAAGEEGRVRPDSGGAATDAVVVVRAHTHAHTGAHSGRTGPSRPGGRGPAAGGGAPPPGLGPNRPLGKEGVDRRGAADGATDENGILNNAAMPQEGQR